MANWKPGQHHRRNKNPNILEGLPSIAEWIGKSINTTRLWIREHGLPATKTPRGIWFTHKGLILQWMYAGHQAELKTRIAYALDESEIASLAVKMDVDSEEVIEMMHQEQDKAKEELASRKPFKNNGKENPHEFR